MAAGGSGEFYKLLGTMIHCSEEDALSLVHGLNANEGSKDFFVPYFQRLPEIKIITEKGEVLHGNQSTKQALTVSTEIGRGTFSLVYANSKPNTFTYKLIKKRRTDNTGMSYLYASFKEIIIQLFLQSDKTMYSRSMSYGDFICKLQGIYRTSDEIILKMEYLSESYGKSLRYHLVQSSIMAPATPIEMDKIIKQDILNFITLLKYFRDNYNFHHQDLKIENVMVGEYSQMKLIDFGYESYIEIDGVKLGSIQRGRDDVYLFIDSLQELIGKKITPGFNATLEALKSRGYDTLDEYITELKKAKGGSRKKTRRLRRKRRV